MLDFLHITIYPDCRYRKNLEAGLYSFDTWALEEYYGSNVRLHAIVGKNGSGKSSLLDIMIRIINNAGALMCKKEKRDASDRVSYVRHIHADLAFRTTFAMDGESQGKADADLIHVCKICVRDTSLWLEFDDELYWLSDADILRTSLQEHEICRHMMQQYGRNFHDYSDMQSDQRKHEIASMLFYTIATNYSMLGFQASDYAEEESLEYDEEIRITDSQGRILTTSKGEHIVTAGWVDKKNWINGVFHKNDGYMCPLVLNPYRDGGVINMNNEASLTVSRLSALLLMYLHDRSLIDDYQLDYISYEYKEDFYKRFDAIVANGDPEKKNQLADGGYLKIFRTVAMTEKTWSWTILDELGIPLEEYHQDIEVAARLYIVYKILNIAATYPRYAEYRKIGKINKVFDGFKQVPSSDLLRELIGKVVERKTHIEQKFHQAYRFVMRINEQRGKGQIDLDWLNKPFRYQEFIEHIPPREEVRNLDDCLRILPPNLFRQTIYLKRVMNGRVIASGIPFNRMSSGQRQMLYQLSTLIYHCLNLNSVPENEIRYHNLNIILDEIEVCFHPEYQRMFISRMLELLCDTLHLNHVFGIHIWLTTHSPFILSDIPEPLITYMKHGHIMSAEERKKDGIMPPMAANVSDLLQQSFFLENGFIGEYARKNILRVISYLRNETSDGWDEDTLHSFIESIGEPFIKRNLMQMWKKRYEKDFD